MINFENLNINIHMDEVRFCQLKETFKSRIPPRKLRSASNCNEFVKILWKCNLLNNINLTVVKSHLAADINACNSIDDNLRDLLAIDCSNNRNLYADERLSQSNNFQNFNNNQQQQEERTTHLTSTNTSTTTPTTSQNLSDLFELHKPKIYKLIREDIGSKCIAFGRELGLREGTLDDIDANNSGIERKVDRILQKFEEQNEKNDYFRKICKALDESRRKDLTKAIIKIMGI